MISTWPTSTRSRRWTGVRPLHQDLDEVAGTKTEQNFELIWYRTFLWQNCFIIKGLNVLTFVLNNFNLQICSLKKRNAHEKVPMLKSWRCWSDVAWWRFDERGISLQKTNNNFLLWTRNYLGILFKFTEKLKIIISPQQYIVWRF